MQLSEFNWAAFSKSVETVLVYFLQKVRAMEPTHHLYVFGTDSHTYDALINPIANSLETLEAVALEKFPVRPKETSFRVLKWDPDYWKFQYYCDHNDPFEVNTLGDFWEMLSQLELEDDELERRNLDFRRAVVRALITVKSTPEFQALPKTEDFALRYYENEDLIFKSQEEMEVFLNL